MIGFKKINHRQILDNMSNGVYCIDQERKIQYWNTGAESLTGFTAKEMTGKPFDQTPVRHEDNRGNLIESYEHPVSLCFQEKKPTSKNFFIKTKDNRTIPVEETASPLYRNGKMVGVIASFRDISRCIMMVKSQLKSEKKE